MAQGIPAGLSPAAGRRFGVQVGLAFIVLGSIARWREHSITSVVLWSLGVALVAGGLLAPAHMGPIYRGWMRFALALSKITTPLIMGAIYFVVLLPTGLLLRLFGHRPIQRSSSAATFWIQRGGAGDAHQDMTRQF